MPQKRKILVIDADKNVQTPLRICLETGGYQVYSALDAAQGFGMVRNLKPDLIVLDIKMPAGGGQSVFDRVKMSNMTMHIPILIYTSTSRDEIEQKIPAIGATPVLPKDASPADILAEVKKLLSDS